MTSIYKDGKMMEQPQEEDKFLKELIDIRNKLYDRLPSGNINPWDLLQTIKWHINDLDNFCSKYTITKKK